MALVVEDGTGLSNADSYLSQADADTFHANRGATTAWDAVTDKDVALRLATQYLNNKYRTRWQGTRIVQTMSLSHPRNNVVDFDGFLLLASVVPQVIKDATAILALKTATETLLPDVSASERGVEVDKVKVGPITVATSYFGGSDLPYYPEIDQLLSDILNGSEGEVVRG